MTPILQGTADVVYGSRFLRGRGGAPFVTFLANRVLTIVTNALFSSALTDMETCYKVMRTDVARPLALNADRFDIGPEITARLLRHGHRIHELPVRFEARARAQGKKIGWRDGIRALQVKPFLLFEPREEPLFRQRSASSAFGRLDWPPAAEMGGRVRIYRPDDRERYVRGEPVATEYAR